MSEFPYNHKPSAFIRILRGLSQLINEHKQRLDPRPSKLLEHHNPLPRLRLKRHLVQAGLLILIMLKSHPLNPYRTIHGPLLWRLGLIIRLLKITHGINQRYFLQ